MFCKAVVEVGDGPSNTNMVLRTHALRIEDPLLKQAFRAAVGLRVVPGTSAARAIMKSLYRRWLLHLDFLWRSRHLIGTK